MGITFYPTDKKAETHSGRISTSQGKPPKSTAHLVYDAVVSDIYVRCPPNLFMSSFPMEGNIDPAVVPVRNGLIDTVLEAYNQHRMLVIRPDDVWIAILTQFNYFVNANAEELRGSFVAHEGRKELCVEVPSLTGVEWIAKEMVSRLEENITDPALREWIIPNFTTTTAIDKTVGAIIMMSTLQGYFGFSCRTMCGLPAVTLEGEKKDWQSILRRIEKLKEYGLHTTIWYHLLRPVLRQFVKAYDDPSSTENLKFWTQVIHEHGGSGGPWITGWITGFCVFDRKGKWVGPQLKPGMKNSFMPEDNELEATSFWEKYMQTDEERYWYGGKPLELDGVNYGDRHMEDAVAPGCVRVPVKLIDDGAPPMDAGLIAGLGAYSISSSGDMAHSVTGNLDTVQPLVGWWFYIDDDETKHARKTMEEELARRNEIMRRLRGEADGIR